VARPDTVLKPDQHYIVACEPSVTGEVMQLLRG
jgi:Trk K+ transport system NAD-binding subunit